MNNSHLCQALGLAIVLVATTQLAQAEIVGHWTFEEDEELIDLAGNFPDLTLKGDAELVDGQLRVTGKGVQSTGWAATNLEEWDYSGPTIEDHTLVVWVTLEGLDDTAKGDQRLRWKVSVRMSLTASCSPRNIQTNGQTAATTVLERSN